MKVQDEQDKKLEEITDHKNRTRNWKKLQIYPLDKRASEIKEIQDILILMKTCKI